eukprot:TRINITY_DN23111_c0_g1_i3.p1 TRINITY_DN23111_c0_g1~~TRINITY_DN23111_c0_g1_i3.p1  ORF type:complete len:222 (+),score=54.15 TRINITY_DN23111_c0_g1_i3:83-748(+)
MGRLILVRHGETDWNRTGRLQGQLDVPLNEAGVDQAKAVAKVMWNLRIVDKVDAVVSSDLSRASQTADLIAEYCPSAQRLQDAALREISAGEFEGKYIQDIQPQRQALSSAWMSGDYDARYPGGESINDIAKRGVQALHRAAGLGETVIVVAHGGLIKWSAINIERTAGASDSRMDSLKSAPLRNCCVSVVSYDVVDGDVQLRGERWFQDLLTKEAREDTG